ncbi:MAG: Gfo/Idh/MocA family protein [bacterium]|jgi:predicted dehydrogenase
MIKVGVIGIGKMGISHLAILGARHDVNVVGIADTSSLVTGVLSKYGQFQGFGDYREMINKAKPDAAVVAAPTRFHAGIVKDMISNGIHVFVEKPFCLNTQEGKMLVDLAAKSGLVNQVGYHNKFIGTFQEAKKILDSSQLGTIQHFEANMNGPVVIKSKQSTWRSKPEEGGGCLMDYAAHIIDLVNYLIDPISAVNGTILKTYFDGEVEDAVYALLQTNSRVSGVLNVNWSDETYRKMSTSLTIIGTNGKMIVDSTELKVFFKKSPHNSVYDSGWNIRHINQLTDPVSYYLRGEEYSLQMDHFINAIAGGHKNEINTFSAAFQTDRVIEMIKQHKN